MAEQISHKMPESLRRVGKGEYEVKGTELRIVQDADSGKWTVQGHSDDLGAFGSRGAALAKLVELGLVPEKPAEAEKPQEQPEAEVTETTQGIGGRNATQPKEQPKRRPRTRKPAKEAAKASA